MMRRPTSSKRALIMLITAGLCLIVGFCLFAAAKARANRLLAQQAAQRWQSGDLRYAQISVFPETGMSYHDILETEGKIDTALTAESFSVQENARLWMDAYSTETALTVKSSHAGTTARAIATGGDFFAFHPLEMASGWYYSEQDIMHDQVILDRQLAWTLFGSYDLTGMTIYINGVACRIAGVAEVPDGAEADPYGTQATLWLPWSLLEQLSGDNTPTAACYEAVLPNTVSGLAESMVETALGQSRGDYVIVENTGRFGLLRTMKSLGSLGKKVQRTNGIAYPYWENAAQITELQVGGLYLVALICLVWPLILCIWTLIQGGRFVYYKISSRIKEIRR